MSAFGREREQELASEFAELLDRQNLDDVPTADHWTPSPEELRPALEALAHIEAALGAAPKREIEILSGLRIVGEIGSGGMGRVLLAEDDRLGRKVAIKTLHPRYANEPLLRDRFMHEARALARVSHPNIVRIYSLGPANEPPHFVMEHLDGVRLTEAARPLDFRKKAELMQKVLLAVDFLHKRGIIHRDLKPGNILVDRELEPKLLDFGLALDTSAEARRITQAGQLLGTPDYASPEQADGSAPLDERSDVFSLGIVFYEMLTGVLPFREPSSAAQLKAISSQDPVLPRRIDPEVPGELQNICLAALEKNPAHRYASAGAMADDIDRFLAGEPVLANPVSYSRMIAAKIGQHLQDLEAWRSDHVISDAEYDALRHPYDRLIERDDAWIMQLRRLTLQQVSLYFGAWLLAVAGVLLLLYAHPWMRGFSPPLLALGACTPAAWVGLRLWRSGQHRLAIAFLLAFCLLVPITLATAMTEYGIASAVTHARPELELLSKLPAARQVRNAQLWWAFLLAIPACVGLRKFTGSAVFSLIAAIFATAWWLAHLLRLGLIDWLDKDPGRPYFFLIPAAIVALGCGIVLERLRLTDDSRYIYPFFVAFAYVALSGLAAFHEPYRAWLKSTFWWTQGQIEYLFIINGLLYVILNRIFDLPGSAQLRAVSKAFRFVIPGHLLISIFLLGLAATDRANAADWKTGAFEARLFEFLLPSAAAIFVFSSIPKQMKNFLASGLLFLAIGAVRLQEGFLRDGAKLPIILLVGGMAMMLAAARYTPLKMTFSRWRTAILRRL